MFKRILIANRGEIALRIIRTAREMGVECVAVYSDVDDCALHTRMAHVAVPLHGVTPAESYLDMDKILKAAADTGADADELRELSELPSIVTSRTITL